MATLTQVYYNLGIGAVVSSTAFLAFGIAVRLEANRNLTPRAWARPIHVVKNCLSPPYCLSWIHWAMTLRYIDLLSGIPGTGTRKDGWSGPTLRTNLDGIVLLRYHTLQFKVSLLATVLCMVILLPLYYTTPCDPWYSGVQICTEHAKHTDFERLTIANVPPQHEAQVVYPNGTKVAYESFSNESLGYDPIEGASLKDLEVIKSLRIKWAPNITDRYLAYTFTIVVISVYTCYLLWHEWVECLALRRVYYLESDCYGERLDELDDIRTNTDPEDPFQEVRPPFLPHPEMRETIPNVSLHSALYKLPRKIIKNYHKNSEKSVLEHQMEAAIDFFDECIPTRPGFTSSIAAITMVPDAKDLVKVWGRWYDCGKRMRHLRYVKAHLEHRREMQKTGQKGMHDFFVVAPGRAARAAIRATNETVEVVKEYTAEGIETMNEKIAEGIEVIRGLRHSPPVNNGGEQQQKEPEIRDTGDSGAFVASREEDLYDVEANGENEDAEEMTEKNEMSTNDANNNNLGEGTISNRKSSELLKASQSSKSVTRSPKDNSISSIRECGPSLYDDTKADLAEPIETKATISAIHPPSADAVSGANVTTTSTDIHLNSSVPGFKEGESTEHFEYDEFDPLTFAKWIGYSEETELDQVIDTLEIEQLSVYAREMSQSASNCCVYGCVPKSIHFASIEQLEVMLEDAWASAREANALLLLARAKMFKEAGGGTAEVYEVQNNLVKKNDDRKSPLTDTSQQEHQVNKDTAHSAIPEDENVNDEDDDRLPSHLDGHHTKENNGLRQRGGKRSRVPSTRAKYELAQDLVKETNALSRSATAPGKKKAGCCQNAMPSFMSHRKSGVAKGLTSVLEHSNYCVITFTSRQAAIAARQCLVDGKGVQAWQQVQNIPMHPLADAPPRNICFCRGCCRPVTLTIPNREKKLRKICVWVFYVLFCLLYTIPLTAVSQILNPVLLAQRFPDEEIFQDPDSFFNRVLAGISSGYVTSLFFSILPQIFKLLAFSEGSSSSKVKAEENAMRFYWYFMLLTAFTGSSLVNMLTNGILQANFSDELKDILGTVAASITTQQAPVWINWIIVRTFTTVPLMYLLQILTFVYGCLRLHCLNRVMRGGGPGGPPPYRIYIDSGVVFMCITSLAPACPIVAPAALIYYMVFIPILRWLHIFVYRPFYDGGGNRLSVIHEIIISSLILGQLLLGVILLLKQSFICGLFVVLMPIPTYFFSVWTREKFERSYDDAGLWQTSKLDRMDRKETIKEREKYRRWLVDCHKASYVPICLSGGEDFLTSQPAAVVPIKGDDERVKRFSSRPSQSPKHGVKVAMKGAL